MEEILADSPLNFGPYSAEPVIHHLKLAADVWWRIDPPTTQSYINRAKFFERHKEAGDKVAVFEIMVFECAELFGGSNLKKENGEPMIPMDKLEPGDPLIYILMRRFPADLLMEIWETIGDHFDTWGPTKAESS